MLKRKPTTNKKTFQRREYDFKKTGEVFDNVVKRLENPDPDAEFPTGIPPLDKITGGFHRGHVAIISARPGKGKTALAIQAGWYTAKQKRRVFVFSLEMSAEEMITRIICNELAINNEFLYNKQGPSEQVLDRIVEGRKLFYNTELVIFDDVGYQFDDVINVIDDFPNHPPDLVIIDHVQLVNKTNFFSPNEAIEEYARRCKEVARKRSIAFCLLSQIGRDAESRRRSPRLEHLKGSGALEEIADWVLIGSWDGYESTDYKMDIAKHRHGRTAEFFVKFRPQYYRFEDKEAGTMEQFNAMKNGKDSSYYEVVV